MTGRWGRDCTNEERTRAAMFRLRSGTSLMDSTASPRPRAYNS
jgi:hypothetical protein